MATLDDYCGQEFGSFRIGEHIGSGQEADVFTCWHQQSGLVFVLRLDASEPALWAGPVVLPPYNASVEAANVQGTFLARTAYAEALLGGGIKSRLVRRASRSKSSDWGTVRMPGIYGVVDDHYLVPVAMPLRIPESLDVDRVIGAVQPEDVEGSLLWHDVATAAASAFDVALLTDMTGDRSLTRNLLLRLIVAMTKDRITVDQFQATLNCRFFRTNVTQSEATELARVHQLLQQVSARTSDVVEYVVGRLSTAPPNEWYEPEEFELRSAQRDVSDFTLFLQENAGELRYPVVGYDFSSNMIELALIR